VCITVLTGNRMGWTARCGRPPLLLPSCRKLEFRLSALMDSDLAWVNGKSGRQSWRYADAFQRSIISKAIYHFLPLIFTQRSTSIRSVHSNFDTPTNTISENGKNDRILTLKFCTIVYSGMFKVWWGILQRFFDKLNAESKVQQW